MSDLTDLAREQIAKYGAVTKPTAIALCNEIEKMRDPDWNGFISICEKWLEKYPPDIFSGERGGAGPAFLAALRGALEQLANTRRY